MEVKEVKSLTYRFAEEIVNGNPLACEESILAAKLGLIDYLAASFAGSKDKGVDKLIAIVEEEGGKEAVPLIGRGQRATAFQAALVNGFSGHALDFDDVHSEVRGHPSTVILPALISAAAKTKITGKRFLSAYIIGVEVMARLGKAIGAKHYIRGWHNTSTLGVISAAVAAGYLKGFNAIQIAKVIGFAATQASGLRAQFGTETKPLHAGLAAQAAIRAVKFVEKDISVDVSVFDSHIGFFEVYGEDRAFAESFLLGEWGTEWRIVKPGLWFKIYPFCSAAHHAADAAKELAAKYRINPEIIKEISIIFPTQGDAALVQKQPKTGEQGRFSVEYVVALALSGKSLTLDEFQDFEISTDIQNLINKTRRCYDDSIKPSANSIPVGRFTIVQVITKDNQCYEERVDCPKGAPGNPLSLIELREKLQHSVDSQELAERLLGVIDELTILEDIDSFLDLLV